MSLNRLKALFNPEQYHGWGRNKKYFEGWYFKIVNQTGDRSFAIIPGIAMDEIGKKQSFIQLLDGQHKTSDYISFDESDFRPSKGKFEVSIKENFFSAESIRLSLPEVKGSLTFTQLEKWPNAWYSPGVMGPFAFTPKMECYHGIVSLKHTISGQLTWKGETVDFTGGRGYLEKDWGHSFPSAYVWIQCNHFQNSDASLIGTVAKIPWMRSSFVGFIAGLWYNDELIQFTTYNFSKLKKSKIDKEEVEVWYENKKFRLMILIQRDSGAELAAPIGGLMDARITETMTATVEAKLIDKKSNTILFHDFGTNAGLEVAGEIDEIQVIH